jgi:1-acyl-sn-glycerol-3-phosphate acyltransferase
VTKYLSNSINVEAAANPTSFASPRLFQRFLAPVLYRLFRFFLRLEIAGLEHLDTSASGLILAPNHVTALDPLLIVALAGKRSEILPVLFVAREPSFYKTMMPFGWEAYGGGLFRMVGALAVRSGTHDYASALLEFEAAVVAGKTACIFPEGTRTKTGEISPARGGVAYLSMVTGSPIIPVAISGLFGLTPLRFFLRRHTVRMHIAAPVYPNEFQSALRTPSGYKAGAEIVMDRVRESLKKDRP